MRFCAIFVCAIATAGCGSGGGGTHGANDGILWISWTIDGAAVSDTACSPIDHLELYMQTSHGGLSIEPIPCLRGLGWEYDNLPTGDNPVELDGLDPRGTLVARGVATVAVTATKPATPAPIDLSTHF